jgi:hypothetical protein
MDHQETQAILRKRPKEEKNKWKPNNKAHQDSNIHWKIMVFNSTFNNISVISWRYIHWIAIIE